MADLTTPATTRPPLTMGQAEDITEPLDKARAVALTLMTSSAAAHITAVASVILDYLDATTDAVVELSEGPKHG